MLAESRTFSYGSIGDRGLVFIVACISDIDFLSRKVVCTVLEESDCEAVVWF